MTQKGAADKYAFAAEVVRRHDRDRFLADLFIPAEARPHFHALHAFNSEIVRIGDAVSDPVLGEIRQEWWRGVLADPAEGKGNPVAEALTATIEKFSLPTAPLNALIEARTFDLYNDPMPSLADFEGYAGETSSALFQLGAMILGGGSEPRSADAAGHAGVAATLVERLLSLPFDARRRQLFLPLDRLKSHGVDEEAIYAGKTTAALPTALGALRGMAREHLDAAMVAVAALPAAPRSAFLPLALVKADLRRLDAAGNDPMKPLPPPAPWRRQWILWRGARTLA